MLSVTNNKVKVKIWVSFIDLLGDKSNSYSIEADSKDKYNEDQCPKNCSNENETTSTSSVCSGNFFL